MHELSITQSVVTMCADRAVRHGAQTGIETRVMRVWIEVGRLSGVVPDALRFCFELCAKDTVVEGAVLEIIETPGRGRCRDCGCELAMTQIFGRCRCGCTAIDLVAGRELEVVRMEVGECARSADAVTQPA